MQSLSGHLLISSPELGDSNFFRSVVFLFQHDEESAAGLILNRPTSHPVSLAVNDVDSSLVAPGLEKDDPARFLYWGGPVEGPLMSLHSSLIEAEKSVTGGVMFSISRDRIKSIVTQDIHPFRVYSGYCGWAPGQLEAEIDAGGWITRPATPDDIFRHDSGRLWQLCCEKTGLEIIFAGGKNPAGIDRGNPHLN